MNHTTSTWHNLHILSKIKYANYTKLRSELS